MSTMTMRLARTIGPIPTHTKKGAAPEDGSLLVLPTVEAYWTVMVPVIPMPWCGTQT